MPFRKVRQVTDLPGLPWFVLRPDRSGPWRHWRQWPHMLLSADRGSDGVAAYFWLLSQGCCLTAAWDWSHGAQNDWKGALRALGLWELWLLMLVAWNAPAGPLSDNTRHRELSEAWAHMFEHTTARSNALFADLLPGILSDKGMSDDSAGKPDIDLQTWEELRGAPPFQGPKEKANLNRFFSTPATARQAISEWHSQLLNFSYLAVEEGWMTTEKVQKVLVKQPVLMNDEATKASTDARRPQITDKILRSSCQNAVVVAVAMYSEAEHNQIARIVLEFAGPVEKWHRSQNHILRDASSSFDWLVSQASGRFMESLQETLDKTADIQALQRCLIECPWVVKRDPDDEGGLRVMVQGDMSGILADGCMQMVARRIARCMFAFGGWLVRFAALHGNEGAQRKVLRDFKAIKDAFDWLELHCARSQGVQDLLDQSFFRHTSVQQFVEVASVFRNNDRPSWHRLAKQTEMGRLRSDVRLVAPVGLPRASIQPTHPTTSRAIPDVGVLRQGAQRFARRRVRAVVAATRAAIVP